MADERLQAMATSPEDLTGLLRQCVQCGLCLPHCATWLATGNEVQSPRGRLILLEEMLSPPKGAGSVVPDSFLEAFDQCIGCRACETACPSGVPFSLLQYGQSLASAGLSSSSKGLPDTAVPGVVLRQMDQPAFLSGMSRAGDLVRGVLGRLAGGDWRRRLDNKPAGLGRLARLLGSMPVAPRSDKNLLLKLDDLCGRSGNPEQCRIPAPVKTGPVVAFFEGCANAGLLADSSRRARDLLVSAGCRLEKIPSQDCCGALASHTGRPGRAADLRRRNRKALAGVADQDAVVVVEAAGCGHELKNYGGDFAARVSDLAVLLAGLELPSLGETPLKVVYHDPCHARHAQGIYDEPRRLLSSLPGLTLVEAAESEVCCGSGGAWGLRYPEISADLALRKASHLAATGADLVVTSNPGCLGQIADGLRLVRPGLPILPLTDLLWYAVVRGQKRAG